LTKHWKIIAAQRQKRMIAEERVRERREREVGERGKRRRRRRRWVGREQYEQPGK